MDSTENLYTKEEIEYVNGISDYMVRDHLLYYIRLNRIARKNSNNLVKTIDKLENDITLLKKEILSLKGESKK